MSALATSILLAHGGQITWDETALIGVGGILIVGALLGVARRDRRDRRVPTTDD